MRKYVIMGVQGSGKGRQAELLERDFDLVHISVGAIFRWNVQHHTKIGAQVSRLLATGSLVDDDLVERVVRERLAIHDWNYGFMIDGFPRTAGQAEFFLERYDIDGVIHLDLPDVEVRTRVSARRICSRCGRDYNLISRPPQAEGLCDVCGGELVVRPDDNAEALDSRVSNYRDQTKPIIELFEHKEFVITVDAAPPVEAVQTEIRQRLGLPCE
jgi:adenylate kinase